MKILIIENNISESGRNNFINFFDWNDIYYRKNFSFNFCNYKEIDLENINNFDGIILSGGVADHVPVLENSINLDKEYKVLENFQKPILGICYGFEVIANFLNLKIEMMEIKAEGKKFIDIIDDEDSIIAAVACLDVRKEVWENHKYCVKEKNDKIKIIAKSERGIEIFVRVDRPTYAIQFHPEHEIGCTACGKFILQNFLEIVKDCRENKINK